jgi:hypothetical protein
LISRTSLGRRDAAGASVVALLFNSVATYVVGQRLYRIPFAIGRKLRILAIGAALCVLARFIHPPTLLASAGIKAGLVAAYFGLLVITHSVLPEDILRARRLVGRLMPRRAGA